MVTWTKVHIAFIALLSALLFLLCGDTGPVDPNSTKTKEEFQFKGSIAGIVLSDDSIPVSGVAVALDSAGNSTVTDSLGHYRIPNVTAGTYKISFTHPHYFDTSISKNITLTIDEDVIGLAMVIRRNPSYFPGSISGTIFDQDLAPIKSASIKLDSIGTTTTSDSAGKFTLSNVIPGTHKLTFSSTNYIDSALAGISVALQQKVTSVAIMLRKNPTFFPGKISGSIIDSATKKGIAGIIVTRIPDGATTSTDSLGLYTFADVPVGSYSLTFTNGDYLTMTIDTVKVTMNQTVVVSQKTVVKKTGTIAGIVTDKSQLPIDGVAVSTDSGQSAITGIDGVYLLTNVPSGAHKLTFTNSKYQTALKEGVLLAPGQALTGVDTSLVKLLSSISGTVLDSMKRIPAAEISVTASPGGYTTITGADGTYTIPNVPQGTYTVTFSHVIFLSKSQNDVVLSDGQYLTGLNMSLVKKTGTIAGIVTDISQLPIAGVAVSTDSGQSAITGIDGVYLITNVPGGVYKLTFTNSQYQTAQKEGVILTPSQTLTGVDTSLVKLLSSISGIVTDVVTGAGISGVAITSTPRGYTTTTGPGGSYTLPIALEGTYLLTFTASQYHDTSRAGMNISAGEFQTGVDIAMNILKSSISGTVQDSMEHTPAEGISVTVTPGGYSTNTGADGTYTIPNVPQGTYTVTFAYGSYLTKSQNNVVLSDGQNLTGLNMSLVKKTGSIAGTVTDKTNSPIAGVSVSTGSGKSAVTGISGTYLLTDIPGGTHTLTFTNSKYNTAQKEGVLLLSGQTLTGIDTSLVKLLSSISGSVTDNSGGAGISGVGVTTTPPSVSTSTAANGAYTLPNVPEGTYILNFTSTIYRDTTLTGVKIVADTFKTGVNIGMQKRLGSVSGTVTDYYTGVPVADELLALVPSGLPTSLSTSSGLFTIKDVPSGTYSIKIAATTTYDSLVIPSISVAPGEAVTGIVAKVKRSNKSMPITGRLTGNVTLVSKIVATLTGDSVLASKPFVDTLVWSTVNSKYNGSCRLPGIGSNWNVEIRVFDSQSKVIGYYGKQPLTNITSIIDMPDFKCTNAVPIANVATIAEVSFNDVIQLHGNAIDSFDINGLKANVNARTNISTWEWKIGTSNWAPRRADTSFNAPSTAQVLACSLKVTDSDGNVSYPATGTVNVVQDRPTISFSTPDTVINHAGIVRCSVAVAQNYGTMTVAIDTTNSGTYKNIGTLALSGGKGYQFSTGTACSWDSVKIRITDDDNNVVVGGFKVRIRPQPLSITTIDSTFNTIKVNYSQSAESDFKEYRIYQKTTIDVDTTSYLWATVSAKDTLAFTTPSPNFAWQKRYYKVYQKDNEGLWSEGSNVVFGNIKNSPPATPVITFPANNSDTLHFGIDSLKWNVVSDPNGDVVHYTVEASLNSDAFHPVASNLTNTAYFTNEYDSVGGVRYRITAIDQYNASSISAIRSVPGLPYMSDIEGNNYLTVVIGTQVWIAQNLKTTKYSDGTSIPNVTDNAAWAALTTPGYCWYGNNETANKMQHGALYNWYVVNPSNTFKIAPDGWHVPTNAEWDTLANFLGGATVAGGKMKAKTGWSTNTGTNESGFSALGDGYRWSSYPFIDQGWEVRWYTTDGYCRGLSYGNDNLISYFAVKSNGYSLRLLRN